MDYEKKYKEALERARQKLHYPGHPCFVRVDEIFPELKDSEDGENKRISKEITQFLKQNNGWNREWLAWLEKQGEHKHHGQRKECEDCQFNYAGECKGYCALKRNEHKPTDNVEPKFNVGDWIISNDGTHTYLVRERKRGIYVMLDIDDDVEFSILIETADKTGRLWSIYDANDGDVLAFDDDTIVIFKDLYNSSTFHSYCYIEDGIFDISKDDMPDWWVGNGFHPATKKQRDLLFQKMADAGYEFVNGHITRF